MDDCVYATFGRLVQRPQFSENSPCCTPLPSVMTEFDLDPSPEDVALLGDCLGWLVGKPPGASLAAWPYNDAPFVVVAHKADPDPRVIYASCAAQACFGHGWDEFALLSAEVGGAKSAKRLGGGLSRRLRRRLLAVFASPSRAGVLALPIR